MSKVIKVERYKCKDCYWYRMEDSVWGHCWKYPPELILVKIFPKLKYDIKDIYLVLEKIKTSQVSK